MMANFGGRRRAEKRVRFGLLFLSLSAFYPGAWALFSPQSFFRGFPGFGFSWVRDLPPYNQHLVQDVGAFYLGFAALLFAAALIMDRRLTQVALGAWLVFDIPHFVFHLTDADLSRFADLVETLALGLTVLVPLLLLPLSRRAVRRPA